MRRRIFAVAVSSAIVAVVLFAIPLAIAAHRVFLTDEQGELERAALRAVATVDPTFAAGDPVELPKVAPDVRLSLYNAAGQEVAGDSLSGIAAPVRSALSGKVVQSEDSGLLVAVVPIFFGERVVGAVAAASPASAVWQRTVAAWLAMLALASLAVLVAVLVARRQARRLSHPLEELAVAARTLGEGDFSVRTERSGLPEIDQTGSALNATADRLGQLVERERGFVANASHQLRTPLTGLRLSLENALGGSEQTLRSAVHDALASADELEQTISELLLLTRNAGRGGGVVRPEDMAEELVRRWNDPLAGLGRPFRVSVEGGSPGASASAGAARQVLDVLIDNAVQHGRGMVEVDFRGSGEALAIDVRDEGVLTAPPQQVFERGWSGATGNGIGLALARQLAESQGGRLLLTRTEPTTTFTLLLPLPPEAEH